jgi:hypothetical protein
MVHGRHKPAASTPAAQPMTGVMASKAPNTKPVRMASPI